jgi:hypothetical protein
MRRVSASLPLALLFTCCAQPEPLPPPAFTLDGIPIYGHAHDLPKSQIRAAITEDRRWSPAGDRIYSIDVANRSELHIYHTERNKRLEEYDVLRRVHGKWEAQERMISGSALLVPTD